MVYKMRGTRVDEWRTTMDLAWSELRLGWEAWDKGCRLGFGVQQQIADT